MVVLRWGCGGGKSKSLPHPFFPTAFFRKESGAAGGRASFGRADDIRPYRAWRCGWAAAAIYGGPTGSHDGSGLPVTLRRLRASCHAAGWAHGRVAKSGLREKCRSGLRPSPVFSSAPCLSSPMRLPSALLRCHAPPVRDARLPSDSGHKRPVCELAWFVPVAPVHPGCSRRLRASCHAAAAARRRLSPSDCASRPAAPPGPPVRSLRFGSYPPAPHASALLFILPEFSPPGQPWRTPCA